jgi:hypothetical protein
VWCLEYNERGRTDRGHFQLAQPHRVALRSRNHTWMGNDEHGCPIPDLQSSRHHASRVRVDTRSKAAAALRCGRWAKTRS